MIKPTFIPQDIWDRAIESAGGEEFAYPSVVEAIAHSVWEERERCARIVMEKHENHPQDGDQWDGTFYDLAESIRAS